MTMNIPESHKIDTEELSPWISYKKFIDDKTIGYYYVRDQVVIAYKKAYIQDKWDHEKSLLNSRLTSYYETVIIELEIPKKSIIVKPKSFKTSGYRTNMAIVRDIFRLKNSQSITESRIFPDIVCFSKYNFGYVYEIGQGAIPSEILETDLDNPLGAGIYFWLDEEKAIEC
ncbi:hypothetical protein QJ850_gp742 [Acanthamoeba polyphaga mimivirus]|uniref:Uncharacterized protein n=1 Tax=Acanthamoeba polyphaga mimivirus Kroon TaxID=3069720 RepID=A0A0G2Y809_9VIRU|nr:hypothetical protein QJ850_gp742 [Acanthamoeba polyphaga mimivirus]AKI79957.1 hypothetical protein [Acanthamoeba polyphaga mimivirus Kroon]